MNIDFLFDRGHQIHGCNLLGAYKKYILKAERLTKAKILRFEDKTEDTIEDLHMEIMKLYNEYVNAYLEFCMAYRNNFDLVKKSPLKETANA
jgi:hypothetical protein